MKSKRGRPPVCDWDAQPLGQVSDRRLAETLGVTTAAVQSQRAKRGIPPCPGGRPSLYDWTDYDHLLGTMPDREVAEIVGCALSTAHHRRKSLGIPAHGRGRS